VVGMARKATNAAGCGEERIGGRQETDSLVLRRHGAGR
jgi:hypothetical protein